MISCVEIENPFRYRSYQVGKVAFYDVQNDSVSNPDYDRSYGKVTKIENDVFDNLAIIVSFESGNHIKIGDCAGLVIIHKEADHD